MTHVPDHFEVAAVVGRAIETVGARYLIGGSLASAFAGEPRSTVDVDLVADLEHPQVTPLVHILESAFYIPETALRRAIDVRGQANLVHQETLIKVDIFIVGGTPLDGQQLARRRLVEPHPGLKVYAYTPEDILLQKLRCYRRGGEVSDRQWRDVIAIIRTQGVRLDRDYLATNAPALDVSALLNRAVKEADGD